MAAVSLSDQMGAMALIDEMRHKKMIVQEHLDLPKRREEVTRRIREYYSSQNIEVDDALVEQGVRAYFDGRLVYEAPPTGHFTKTLAHLYITRSTWAKPLIAGVFVLGLLAGGGYMAHQFQSDAMDRHAQTYANEVTALRETVLRQAEQQRATALKLSERLDGASVPAAGRMLTAANGLIERAVGVAAAVTPEGVATRPPEAVASYIGRLQDDLRQSQELLMSAGAMLSDAGALIDVQERMTTLISGEEYRRDRDRFPAVREAERAVHSALQDADRTGMQPVHAAMTALVNKAGAADAARDGSAN